MKFSIITINYNNCEGLKKTLESVLSQTWMDYEYIIIDGGSTDGSREVIESVSDHLAYWCSEPDKGIYNAMNKGTHHATGEYCLYLNSGDCLYDKNIISKVAEDNYNEDILSGYAIRKDNGKLLREYDLSVVKQLILNAINHQATFVKRSILLEHPYREDYKMVSDWLLWAELLIKNNYSFKILNYIIAIQDMDGISYTQIKKHDIERKRAFQEVFGKRMAETLPIIYRDMDVPSVKKLLYMEQHAYGFFVFCHRLISVLVKFIDFFSKDYSFKEFERTFFIRKFLNGKQNNQ